MLKIHKTILDKLQEIDTFENGSWIHLVNPTPDEIQVVCSHINVESDIIRAALDEEERARIEYDSHTRSAFIIVDVPIIESEQHSAMYSTIPLGIIYTENHIVTVCLKEHGILQDFINQKVKGFFTYKRTRFIFQILYRNASYYLMYLRQIDKKSSNIEQELHKSMKNQELIQLLALEKSLVYFSTSLKSNEIVLEKMMRFDYIKKYEDDTELLEDVIIENKQAIEMANIYSNILSGTMDAFASVISNNLNIVMKFLTSITIVISIPTMIASFFGMNVPNALENNQHGFIIVVIISFILSICLVYVMAKKKLF